MYLSWNSNFNEGVLNKGIELFANNVKNIFELNGKQNVIFSYFNCDDKNEYVIRFSSVLRRSKEEILSEIDWINFLYGNGIEVSIPIKSIQGRYVEELILNDAHFFVSVFKKAHGICVSLKERDDNLGYIVGKQMGKIHRLTKLYLPSKGILLRPAWYYSKLFSFIESNIPETEIEIKQIFEENIKEIEKMPLNNDEFGLIHSDIHYKNFNVENHSITFFDFDDCEYGHFIKDISNIIFYTYFENVEIKDREKKFKIFLLNFFKGYHEENDLPDSQLEFLSVFLKIREIVMYAMLYYWRHFDSCSQWVVEFMKDRKNLLLKGVETIPALNLNII